MDKFQAFVLEKQGDQAAGSIQTLGHDRLPDGEVTIRVRYSSINYKDAMAAQPVSPIVKSYPFVPGIDLAGEVVHSDDPSLPWAMKCLSPATSSASPTRAVSANWRAFLPVGSFRFPMG